MRIVHRGSIVMPFIPGMAAGMAPIEGPDIPEGMVMPRSIIIIALDISHSFLIRSPADARAATLVILLSDLDQRFGTYFRRSSQYASLQKQRLQRRLAVPDIRRECTIRCA
jgi:hypothetical protein